MNRRRFLQLLGMATAGATVAYSFPDIIVPKNIRDPFVGKDGFAYHVSNTENYWQGFGFTDYDEPVFAGIDMRKGVPYYCHRRDLDKLPSWVLTRGEIKVTYPVLDCTRRDV